MSVWALRKQELDGILKWLVILKALCLIYSCGLVYHDFIWKKENEELFIILGVANSKTKYL